MQCSCGEKQKLWYTAGSYWVYSFHDIMNNSYFYQDLTKDLLPLVLDPIVTALKDDDDDVRAVAASALLPVAESLVKFAPSYVSTVWYVGSVIYFMQFTCSFDDMM